MTDATVLADALVEAGILQRWARLKEYGLPDDTFETAKPAREIITDWRVAGKVLESMYNDHDQWNYIAHWFVRHTSGLEVHAESLPRAIIEAWYEARQ